MAIQATVETIHGEIRNLYIRLNNFEQLANHGIPTVVVFRGFLSQEKYQEGAHHLYEQTVEFSANVSDPLWGQAYAALEGQCNFTDAVES